MTSEHKFEIMSPETLQRFAKRRYKLVPAEWLGEGVAIRIQSLTARERAELERRVVDGGADVRLEMIIACCVDDAGRRLFEDDRWLQDLDSDPIDIIFEEIDRHVSALRSRTRALEAAAKNSETIHNDDSQSD